MTIIEDFYVNLDEIRSIWGEIYNGLKSKQYDTLASRPALENTSVDDLNAKIAFIIDLLNGFKPKNDDDVNTTVLSLRAAEMQSRLATFKTNLQPILNNLRGYVRDTVLLRDVNNNFNFQFVEGQNVVANGNHTANFSQIILVLKNLVSDAAILTALCKANGISDLAGRAEALTQLVHEITTLKTTATKTVAKVDAAMGTITTQEKGIQGLLDSSKTNSDSVANLKKEMEQEVVKVTALITQIKTVGAGASTLEQQVATYKAKFDGFQAQLDERLKQFTVFESNLVELDKRNKDSETEISRLIAKADTMIRGATTAGLSKSLEDTRRAYWWRRLWAQLGFLASIVFLTVSALPLAAQFLPDIFGKLLPQVPDAAHNEYADILGKAFLLLPATWVTVFFTKAYSEFFHLEREYAHKATLAKSVEGFKREAPKYQEEITASVFGEILNNPSSRKSPDPATHPFYDIFMKKIGGFIGKTSI